jgi:hypothetical protein
LSGSCDDNDDAIPWNDEEGDDDDDDDDDAVPGAAASAAAAQGDDGDGRLIAGSSYWGPRCDKARILPPNQAILDQCALKEDKRGPLLNSAGYRAMLGTGSCGRGRSAAVFMRELRAALERLDRGEKRVFDPDRVMADHAYRKTAEGYAAYKYFRVVIDTASRAQAERPEGDTSGELDTRWNSHTLKRVTDRALPADRPLPAIGIRRRLSRCGANHHSKSSSDPRDGTPTPRA